MTLRADDVRDRPRIEALMERALRDGDSGQAMECSDALRYGPRSYAWERCMQVIEPDEAYYP